MRTPTTEWISGHEVAVDHPTRTPSTPSLTDPKDLPRMITIDTLTKKYGASTAVDNISFTAKSGPRDRLPRAERCRQVDVSCG